jgi:hypothetical protein
VSWRYLLKKYSTRAWAYRPDIGWIFDNLTPAELALFRADHPPRIETVRVPIDTGIFTSEDYIEGMKLWFMYCTITELHPLAFALFLLCKVGNKSIEQWKNIQWSLEPEDEWTSKMIDYPLEPGLYGGWLWNDEIDVCRALGCDITVYRGYGWDKLTPPTKVAPRPRYSQDRTFIYALADPLTQEVFYVGKSDHPQQRFVQHLRDKSDSTKMWWINELRDRGREPMLMILEEVDGVVALEREDWWIRHYDKPGHSLTNYVSQWRPSKERNQRRRLALQEVDGRKERPRINRQLKQARMQGLAATLTLEDWADTLAYFGWKCAYCTDKPVE